VITEGISASASDNVVDIHSSEEHNEELLVDALSEGNIDHVVSLEDADTELTAPAIADKEVPMDVSNYKTDWSAPKGSLPSGQTY
jgi:hypothetical protein